MNKKFLALVLILLVLIILLTIPLTLGFRASSSSYDSDSKLDSFAQTNASSLTFTQRLIGGIQTVGMYSTNLFSGRFGILGGDKKLIVNITSFLTGDEIVRGNDAVSGEDDKGAILNSVNFTSIVYDNLTKNGFSGANCFFYDNDNFFGNSTTNSSGHCFINFTSSSLPVGTKNISVNYSVNTNDDITIKRFDSNVSIIRYISALTMKNLRTSGCASGVSNCYYDNDNASLEINITKINITGTLMYDPLNISANATNAAQTVYTNGDFFYPGSSSRNISRNSTGVYYVNLTVNQSFGSYLRWDVYLSDNNFNKFISSAVHADAAICAGSFGAFSAWSACVGGLQTRSRTDSTSCIDVQTQSCSVGGGGSGGGGSVAEICIPSWSQWSEWGSCTNNEERRSRNDGCGNTETEIRSCGCTPNWQCNEWTQCTSTSQQSSGQSSQQLSYNAVLENNFVQLSFKEELPPIKIEIVVEQNILDGISSKNIVEDSFDFLQNIFNKIRKITGFAVSLTCENVSDLGNKQCHPTKITNYQECTEKTRFYGTSYSWKTVSCPQGQICVGEGLCECSPTNACDVEGALRCTWPDKFQICQRESSGCLKWTNDQNCARGEICSNGQCFSRIDAKISICTLGDRTCMVNRAYECTLDSKGVLKWTLSQRCSSSQICLDGACISNYCFNQRQDGDESGIDCGGSCPSLCAPPIVCGDGKIEGVEVCDTNSQECIINNYAGSQVCKTNCSGFMECISQGFCGDNIVNGPEICDDGNNVNNDGCSSLCKIEAGIIPELPSINETVQELSPDQVLLNIGQSAEITINKGDQLSVKYEELRNDLILLKIIRIATPLSTDQLEVHLVKVNSIDGEKITVIVSSTPITRDIILGGTEIFDFSEQIPGAGGGESGGGGGGGSGSSVITPGGGGGVQLSPQIFPYQLRNCIDLNQCGVNEGMPQAIQQCIIGNIIFTPENKILTIANGTTIDFSTVIQEGVGNVLEVSWFVGDSLEKGNSGSRSLVSSFSYEFFLDSTVEARVKVDNNNQNERWIIKINPNAKPNCAENWYCNYDQCDGKYKLALGCEDLNQCGTTLFKPLKKECNCIPNYECDNWKECNVKYDINDILYGRPSVSASQQRNCYEKTNCIDEPDTIVKDRECKLSVPIYAEKKEWCFEEYVELYEKGTNKLVGRFKQRVIENILAVDIGFTVTESKSVCNYCFDTIKNFNELDIDCGGSCQQCVDHEKFFDYLYFAKISISLLWLLLLIILLIIYHYSRKEIIPRFKLFKTKEPRHKFEGFKLFNIYDVIQRIIIKRRLVRRVSWPRDKFEDLRRKLGEWKRRRYYETIGLEKELGRFSIISKKPEELVEIKKKEPGKLRRYLLHLLSGYKIKHQEKKRIKKERKLIRKEARLIKRRLRRKEVSRSELNDLRRKLRQWQQKGYYNTGGLQKKLDKYERKGPFG